MSLKTEQNTTDNYELFNQEVSKILGDFRLNVKCNEIDEDVVSEVGVNTDETLDAYQLDNLLELKEKYAFHVMSLKRSGTGIRIEYKL